MHTPYRTSFRMRLITPLLAFLVVACSPDIIVNTDFDRSVQLPKLTNYNWLPVKNIEARNNPLFFNELNDARVKTAVNKQLADKGYKLNEMNAEFIVHYHITIEDKTAFRPEPFGYNYSPYWKREEMEAVRYREGTLIVDLMDTRNCNLIWRGWATSILDDQNLVTEELINRAITKIFEKFPESAAKEITEP